MKDDLERYLAGARWFGGKGRDFHVASLRSLPLGPLDGDRPGEVVIELVEVAYADDPERPDTYQVPLLLTEEPREDLAHALVGHPDGRYAYDALHDHDAAPLWLRAFAAGTTYGEVAFHRVGDAVLDLDARSSLMSVEQSNSSVAFGEDSMMKVFRRVTPGSNPDIEILAALTEAGSEHVPALYGWYGTHTADGEPLQLGILQQFLRTATDGWEVALTSLRVLLTDHDEDPVTSGGDFAAESERLGVALAEVHAALAEAFPTHAWGPAELDALASAMSDRLEAAARVVPELAEHAPRLHAVFDRVRNLTQPVSAQRVHGDLHLGQTLRTVKGWKIIDFEGEPAKPLSERVRPDCAWRDVAGMVRSFDYAAETMRASHGDASDLARAWADRNTAAFLAGYTEASRGTAEPALLDAYIADKAVYEAVYEARNRPTWLPTPMAALARLATPGGVA